MNCLRSQRQTLIFGTHPFLLSPLSSLWALSTQGTVILTLPFTCSVSFLSNITFFFTYQPPQHISLSLGFWWKKDKGYYKTAGSDNSASFKLIQDKTFQGWFEKLLRKVPQRQRQKTSDYFQKNSFCHHQHYQINCNLAIFCQ